MNHSVWLVVIALASGMGCQVLQPIPEDALVDETLLDRPAPPKPALEAPESEEPRQSFEQEPTESP